MPELIGNDVLYRKWESSGKKAVLLLVHGMGAHTDRWNFVGEYFSEKGFPCYAIELKGFGKTPNRPRGHIDSFNTYYQDIVKLRQIIDKEHPRTKVFLFAESMGGLISFMLLSQNPYSFSGQILISPAFQNGMKFAITSYLKLAFFLIFNQKGTLEMPFTSAMCTRDVAYQNIMNNNPDELRLASAKLLLEILFAQMKVKNAAKQIANSPSLFLLSGKDYLVDEKFGEKLIAGFKLNDKTVIKYPEMLHALSIELGREKVFADVLNWLLARI
jgi:alpha-beta hydrolase superfamily lysophospholipase